MATEAYAIIATIAGTYYGVTATVGEVVNRVVWDGVADWAPPAGTEARADPTGLLQIGQVTTV
jgi:hypothetical protein